MILNIELKLSPREAHDEKAIHQLLIKKAAVPEENINDIQLVKRSIDARKKNVLYLLRYLVYVDEEPLVEERILKSKNVKDKESLHIIGFGPAGMFAALQAIKMDFKPIIYERGKDVRSRRRDLAAINKEHKVNPESNYCFGEGGAGTYSDGKLYTRSKKRGDVQEVLKLFVEHGADKDILIDAHPHIGTNKLPKIITSIREYIIDCGGEVHFQSKLSDFEISDNRISSIEINHEQKIKVNNLILATGHSARDIFIMLNNKGVEIEAKKFAMGVRVEHPQTLIDRIQYGNTDRGEFLPPSAYSLVKQVDGKGVYSFCMCPGGIIAPCATSSGEIVTNGWSPSKRNNPFANSGIVVSVDETDWKEHEDKGGLAAMYFQQELEQKAYQMANVLSSGKGQTAPAQALLDFVESRESKHLMECSYQPGILPARIDLLFPKSISKRLQEAFRHFGASMKGYLSNDAVVLAVESRTSSPVRIPRDKETFHHIRIKNLYPAAEGAGYAGGIVSAAIDGMKCAQAALS